MALEGLSRGIFSALGILKSRRKLNEDELKEMLRSLRRALQEADFNVRQTKEITEKLESRMRDEEPRPGITLQTHAMNILYTELVRLLGPPREVRPHQSTILMVGLYGNGKTTTTAKLAEWYRRRHGVRVAVIEADVHRPGAYNQLSQLLEDSSVEVYGEPENKNAVDIVKNGLKQHAAADLVIIDTAGRHKLDEDLVVELEQISEVANANERFLVIDAQVGQSAGPVAANFHDLAGVTGIVITKLDGTARGGGALSAVATTGAPVMYIGTGEKVADLEKFESDRFISRLLGMGDIRGLIDLAPEDMDEEEAMQANLDRYRVIMDSMTTYEKDEPAKIKADRIRRIARGSGVKEKDVRELIGQWNRSRKMMKGMSGNRKMNKQMKRMMRDSEMDFDGLEM